MIATAAKLNYLFGSCFTDLSLSTQTSYCPICPSCQRVNRSPPPRQSPRPLNDFSPSSNCLPWWHSSLWCNHRSADFLDRSPPHPLRHLTYFPEPQFSPHRLKRAPFHQRRCQPLRRVPFVSQLGWFQSFCALHHYATWFHNRRLTTNPSRTSSSSSFSAGCSLQTLRNTTGVSWFPQFLLRC